MDSYNKLAEMKRALGRTVRHSHFYWRYVANGRPWLEYRFHDGSRHAPGAEELVHQLKRDGVAITTARTLFGNTMLFDELETEVQRLEQEKFEEIHQARERKDEKGFKTYLIELLGPRPVLDPASIFVRIAVAPEVLEVANAYFGMLTRLKFFNVWRNFAVSAPPRNSQLWHRDPEDRFILKMFVYLSDVDDDAGPLFYAPGTHGYGNVKSDPKLHGEEGTTARRADDEGMSAVVEQCKWVKAAGPKGTVVFVDTRGYHKGGLVRTHDRIVYNCMFTSQASPRGEYFDRKPAASFNGKTVASFALGTMS